jgi:hypothetical protein
MTLGELRKLLDGKKWRDFENTVHGTITIDGIDFHMRVGLFACRPMQVIIANSQFIRMRSAPQYEKMLLVTLDPRKPEATMYTWLDDGAPIKMWKPRRDEYLLTRLVSNALKNRSVQMAKILLEGNTLLKRLRV